MRLGYTSIVAAVVLTAANAVCASAQQDNVVVLQALPVHASSVVDMTSGIGTSRFNGPASLVELPMAVTVVDLSALEERGVDQVQDLAPLAPGVSAPFRFGNLTTPHIRGDLAEAYRNGQRVGSSLFSMQPGFNAVEAVTMGRGPAGAVMGPGLYTGGYVNYTTKKASLTASRTRLSFLSGGWSPAEHSWDHYRWQIDHNQPIANNAAVRLSYEGQDDETFYGDRNSVARYDYQDLFAAVYWAPSDRLTVELNGQYRKEDAPQLLGVNRPTPLLLEKGLYYTGEPEDGVLFAGEPWFLTPTGLVELPRDALMMGPNDYSDAESATAQAVVTLEASPDLVIVNRTLVENIDRKRYHGFEYAEFVQALTLDNRIEAHFPLSLAGRDGGAVAGVAVRREERESFVNYFNEYFFNFDIASGLPVALPDRFPLTYFPGQTGPDGLPFFGAEAGSAETVRSTLDNVAAFLHANLEIAPQWTIAAGVRADCWMAESVDALPPPGVAPWSDDYETDAISGDISLSWQPVTGHAYYIAYRQANAVYGSVTGGGIMLYPDPEGGGFIDAEDFSNISRLWEVGGRWRVFSDRAFMGLSAFQQDRQRNTFRGGADDIDVRGLELEAQYVQGSWRTLFNIAYIDGRYDNSAPYQHGGRSLWNHYDTSYLLALENRFRRVIIASRASRVGPPAVSSPMPPLVASAPPSGDSGKASSPAISTSSIGYPTSSPSTPPSPGAQTTGPLPSARSISLMKTTGSTMATPS